MWSLRPDTRCTALAAASGDALAKQPPTACPQSNFWRGCSWSPDGTCILAATDDNVLRVFPLPTAAAEAALSPDNSSDARAPAGAGAGSILATLEAAVTVHQGESVYDFKWYPGAVCSDPASACFASTSRGHPVHLWDAMTGRLRTSYRTYDDADQVTAAYCLEFLPDCTRLLGGLKEKIAVWDLSRPGRDHGTLATKAPEAHQKGIVSALAVAPGGDLVAAGSFNKALGVYDLLSGDMAMLLRGHSGGITHVQFSRCGNFVYSGARKDGAIHCWDVRNTCECLYSMPRAACDTNQRLAFDIEPCGRHLLAGAADGTVELFDLASGQPCQALRVGADSVGGVSMHPMLPLLATASGHRRFFDDEEGDGVAEGCNMLSVWLLDATAMDRGGGVAGEASPVDAEDVLTNEGGLAA